MKKLLLIGDSIRMGYEAEVKKNLENEFEVWAPPENCRFAKYTLCHLKGWLNAYGETPDVIHWNNGFWDTCIRYEEDGNFTKIEEYERDMLSILRELKKMTDKVIFATTTPVNPKHHDQKNETVDFYNKVIVEKLKKENVFINDLNTFVKPHIDEYICEDLLHLSEKGQKACGKAVSDFVLSVCGK